LLTKDSRKRPADEKSPSKKAAAARELRTGEAAIEQALDEPTEINFIDTPLLCVIDYLKDRHHIEIQLDKPALEDAGVGSDVPIKKSLKGISLRSALRLTLRDLNLTYMIRDEVLLITSPEVADANLTKRVYDVADLVVYNDDKFGRWDDYEPLKDIITTTIEPATWDAIGGPGSINGASLGTAKVLVVSQTYEVHRQIADLLKQIRAVAAKHIGDGLPHRDRPVPVQRGGGQVGVEQQQPAAAKKPPGQNPGGGMFAVPGEIGR
jgi:hypothetical protein